MSTANSTRHTLTLVVAATSSNGIGKGGGLPWKLSQEMKYFAKVTNGAYPDTENPNAVIMGRKTWDGIPAKFRPLKGRRNLVVSRNSELDLSSSPLTSLHPSLESAISPLPSSSSSPSSPRSFLIGGSQLYSLALSASPTPLVDRILLTRVRSPDFPDCDAFLPEFRERTVDGSGEKSGKHLWKKSSWEELVEWIGFEPEGGLEGEERSGRRKEKGVEYEFEMWTLQE